MNLFFLKMEEILKVLFQDSEVQRLLDDFQRLAGVRIAVFDTNFVELYSSPRSRSNFCSFIRNNQEINTACKYCDQKAFREAKINKDTYIYNCHLGLYEAVTPIFDRNQILGYVMIGQVLKHDSLNHQWENLQKKFKLDENELATSKKYFFELKQMNVEEIEAVSRIMKACASSIWLQYIIDIERSPVSERIKNYLEENYYDELTTEKVCMDLGFSKTTIYNYLKSEFDMSLNQYINYIRLDKAKDKIINSKKSISEISDLTGFEDYNYFSRKFKERFKMSPTKFRKSLS